MEFHSSYLGIYLAYLHQINTNFYSLIVVIPFDLTILQIWIEVPLYVYRFFYLMRLNKKIQENISLQQKTAITDAKDIGNWDILTNDK